MLGRKRYYFMGSRIDRRFYKQIAREQRAFRFPWLYQFSLSPHSRRSAHQGQVWTNRGRAAFLAEAKAPKPQSPIEKARAELADRLAASDALVQQWGAWAQQRAAQQQWQAQQQNTQRRDPRWDAEQGWYHPHSR